VGRLSSPSPELFGVLCALRTEAARGRDAEFV